MRRWQRSKYIFCKILPGVIKRVYNLHNKQLLKVFSAILKSSHDHMSDHLDNSGDISLTVEHYFLKATSAIQPIPDDSASLMLVDVEKFLGAFLLPTK